MGKFFPNFKNPEVLIDTYRCQYYNHFVIFFLIIGFTLITFPGNAVTYFVSSTMGNDANSGTSENSPWQSITKVNNYFKLYPGDQILFKKGDEWTGTLKVNISGTTDKPIVFGSYGTGNKPKIYGSEKITGWTKHSGNIYKASFTTDITQLFVNGFKMKLSRFTNSGYSIVNSISSQTQFTSNTLDPGVNYSGATVLLRTENWYSIMRTVTSSSTKTLSINLAPTGTIKVNQGFVLMNKLEFLDSPGEWYYDSATDMVYVWTPDGDSPANYEVRGSTLKEGIIIGSKDYITIQDLHILQQKETGFQLTSYGGVSSTNVIVQRNSITGQEGFGIYDDSNRNQYFTIENNEIDDCNGIGIYMWIANTVIRDNTVTNIGVFDKLGLKGTWNNNGGTGIEISGNGNTIEYNRLIGINYNGIFWRGNSILQYNFIKNACLYKSDGGGIYTGGTSAAGSTVRYNIVDNVVGSKEGGISGRNMGEGIYFDEPSHNIICEYNTVVNCSNSGIFLHRVENHTIRNNTIMDARYGFFAAKTSGSVKSNFIDNLIVTNNETDDVEPRQLAVYYSNANITLNNNKYASPFDNDLVFKYSDDIYRNFNDWKKIVGADSNSEFTRIVLRQGESQKLIYNDTKQTKTYNLGNSVFRNIFGESIVDTFMLKPFTSIVLIGKDFDKINQSPSILDQSFNFVSPKATNDSIGKVVATDPDSAQIIYYSIIQGNEKGWFSIDTLTGQILAKTDIQSSKDLSFDLLITVMDSAIYYSSDTAKITITIIGRDTSPPVITSFSIPPQYISLTIPITSFIATDDVAVVDFIITENSNKPTVEDKNWSTVIPNEFTFSKVGFFTLYAWVKDSTGNISESKSDTVNVKLPDLSPTFSEYLYEESADSLVLDSKSSNNGTLVNEIIRDEGVIGQGLKFNSSGFINLGHSFGENVENEITLSTWIKPSENNGENQGIFFHGGLNSHSFALYLNSDSQSISFNTSGTTNSTFTVNNVNELWDGNWHHLLVTYNGLEKVIYLDNVVVSRLNASGKIDSGWGFNLLIGAGTNEISPALLYEGMIDETRIYNYALNSDEIRELFDTVNRIYKKITTVEFISICEGDEYFGWTDIGQYERVLKRKLASDSNADSTVITHLWVNNNYQNTDEATICEGGKITLGLQELTIPGEYIEVFNSINGCDSTIFFTLNVIPKIVTTEAIDICEGEYYILGTQTLSQSGEYAETYQSINGCDSIVALRLTVNKSYNINEDIIISVDDNYLGWSEEGEYQRLLKTKTGCDSIVVTNLKVVETVNQNINLEKGWNIISSYLIPLNDNVISVMEKLRIDGQLIKVKDESDNTYEELGNQLGWVNNIGNFQKTEGYKIRVENDCELEIVGVKINLPLNITLKKGLNLISFPLESSTDALQIIEPLINSGILIKVQDERGNSIENWANIGWINGIGNFQVGEGYIVQVNENGILSINDISEKSTQNIVDIPKPEHFKVNYEGNGYEHMNINFVDLKNSQLKTGDEIAVFDNNICVGAVKLIQSDINSNRISIPASSTETNINNGFKDGNSIAFKIWNKETNHETKILPEVINGNLIYKKQASVFIKLSKEPDLSENVNIYPNPANEVVIIRFLSLPEDGAEIQLFDVTGKKIFNREIITNVENINIENLPAGVYFIKTYIKNQSNTTKLIVI